MVELDDFLQSEIIGMSVFFYLLSMVLIWKVRFVQYDNPSVGMIANWGTTILLLPITWLVVTIVYNK